MAYCDYTWYTDEFRQGYKGGTFIGPDAFPYYAGKASLYVRNATKGDAEKVTGDALYAVKNVTCAVAEALMEEESASTRHTDSGGGVVASESVGNWSKTFVTGVSASDAEYWDKRKRDLLLMYLGALPEFAWLFRAVSYRCVHEARGRG